MKYLGREAAILYSLMAHQVAGIGGGRILYSPIERQPPPNEQVNNNG